VSGGLKPKGSHTTSQLLLERQLTVLLFTLPWGQFVYIEYEITQFRISLLG